MLDNQNISSQLVNDWIGGLTGHNAMEWQIPSTQ